MLKIALKRTLLLNTYSLDVGLLHHPRWEEGAPQEGLRGRLVAEEDSRLKRFVVIEWQSLN